MKGRPKFEYTEQLANEILEAIATSEKGLHLLCKENKEWPSYRVVYEWIQTREDFRNKYARAREEQADYLADQIIEIADDSSGDIEYDKEGNERENREFVSRSKLKVEARKWKASKLAPKKYGDKLEVDQNVSGSIVWKEERSYEADNQANKST